MYMYLYTFKLLSASINDTWMTNADRREEEVDDRAILWNEDDFFFLLLAFPLLLINPLFLSLNFAYV